MAHDEDVSLAHEEHLWKELETCMVQPCETHESIDDALREWLDIAARLQESREFKQDDVLRCAQALRTSAIFQNNTYYVQTQLIHSLLQEDGTETLHIISMLLLLDGHFDGGLFSRMIREACFPRLLELIRTHETDPDTRLHRLLLQLAYEMSRIERLKREELALVDDDFIHSLFRIIEGVSNDANDPYHYPTIRVLLVMNEQYMLASTDVPGNDGASQVLTNRIVKCISLYGPHFMTFGENIILLLNRETETSLQLLILKLLYLLFTTKATYEYFYTNDLRVLLDVIIRNLMDLPDERMSLRHTYLRVLYPLLAHTQLSDPPHYKEDEIVRLVKLLRGSHNAHFAPADETTLRLTERVAAIPWIQAHEGNELSGSAVAAQKILGISLSKDQYASSISVGDVATVTEKPGVQTPSRNCADKDLATDSTDSEAGTKPRTKKPLPAVPKHRHGIPFAKQFNSDPNKDSKRVPPKAPPPRRVGKAAAQANGKHAAT